jgi:hypothetical protein
LPSVLGTVSDQYQPHQKRRGARVFDPIVAEGRTGVPSTAHPRHTETALGIVRVGNVELEAAFSTMTRYTLTAARLAEYLGDVFPSPSDPNDERAAAVAGLPGDGLEEPVGLPVSFGTYFRRLRS